MPRQYVGPIHVVLRPHLPDAYPIVKDVHKRDEFLYTTVNNNADADASTYSGVMTEKRGRSTWMRGLTAMHACAIS
jgi:hypothetical protein